MEQTYHINILADKDQGVPGLDADFGRVTVILGANGTGKSRLIQKLQALTNNFGDQRPLVHVEGGRVVQAPQSVGLTRKNIDQFNNLEEADRQHRKMKRGKLADRVTHMLTLLYARGERAKSKHSDEVVEWDKHKRVGDIPQREEPPLDKLFRLFNETFPEIDISLDGKTKNLKCRKGTVPYNVSTLSDGERQVLALLADIAILGDPQSLILVDEPELNLNPYLAHRLWNSVETSMPKAVFVYATHSLSFAMRSSVDQVLVLGGQGRQAMEVSDVGAIDQEELREFLGAIPAILAAPAALVVEGQESSFDTLFYEWLLGRKDVAIVPVGGCKNVSSAVKKVGVWERLAPSIQLVGIVDRDYRDDKELSDLSAESCLTLDLHEAESYLCQPTVICHLANALVPYQLNPDTKNKDFKLDHTQARG
ncbi:MAG: AAA family ATPase [Chloroflexota bacterium]|nr:AAA family ATPase [Chloroflexota bacterium]